MTVTQNELQAFLEEGAKKFGISTDALIAAVWQMGEEKAATKDLADCLSVTKLEVSGDWAFGTLNFYGDAREFQYNVNSEELRIPGATEEMQDMAPAIIGEIKFTIGESVKITDVEIDGKLITGTIEYEGTTAAFEYDATTETWSTKDEFTPEMDAAANLIDKTVRNSVAKWRVHEMQHDSVSQFEIAQGIHTFHVIHPDFGDKSLFEIDIPEDIATMSAEDVQSFIDGTLEDVAGYLNYRHGLELTAADINALKGELKEICDEKIAGKDTRNSLESLIAAAGETTPGNTDTQSRSNREDR